MTAPTFLAKDRHGGYLFRRIIPVSIRHHFGHKRELRKSLRTHHRGTALQKARCLAAQIDRLFGKLAKMAGNQHDDDDDLFSSYSFSIDLDELGRPKRITCDAKPEETDDLNRALSNAMNGLHEPGSWSSPSSTTQQTSEPISQLWQAYRKEKQADKKWKSDKIAEGFDAHLRTFIELLGDLRPHEISVQTCIKYKEDLLDYPIRRFIGNSASMSLDELRSRPFKPLQLATRSAHMTTISTFIDWLIQRDLAQSNHLTAKKLIPRRDKRKERRDPFTKDDLKLIFSQDRFRGGYKRNWHHWMPVLGLYTGARIEELAQLRVMDICESEDEPNVYFINICIRDDFSPKTINGVRGIPVHSKLIEMGFLDLVKAAGNGHLFPAAPNSDGRRSPKMSNDFSRLKTELGFGKKKVFHSFRNTFIGALSLAGVADSKVNALIGHAQDDLAFAQYWQINAQELNAAAKRINFDDVLVGVNKWEANRP